MIDTPELLAQCAPQMPPVLMHALVHVESAWRPFAIGMDASQGAVSQPKSLAQAISKAEDLSKRGRQFSVGLAQVHVSNIKRFGISWEQAFDVCTNLRLGQDIFAGFYRLASRAGYEGNAAVRAALRGYNSGGITQHVSDAYATQVVRRAKKDSVDPPSAAGRAPLDAIPEAAGRSGVVLRLAVPAPNGGDAPVSQVEAREIFQKAAPVPGF